MAHAMGQLEQVRAELYWSVSGGSFLNEMVLADVRRFSGDGKYLDLVRYYASSDNIALLPLVVRLNSLVVGN
jgi:hypothetical protein